MEGPPPNSWVEEVSEELQPTVVDLLAAHHPNARSPLQQKVTNRLATAGQTENEIKNYWNTNLTKKVQVQGSGSGGDYGKRCPYNKLELEEDNVRLHEVIRMKAVRCTRVLIPLLKSDYENNQGIATVATVAWEAIFLQSSLSCSSARTEESRGCLHPPSPNFLAEFNVDDLLLSYTENPEMHFHSEQDHLHNLDSVLDAVEDGKVDAKGLEGWGTDDLFGSNRCFDFNALSAFLEEDNGSDSNEKD